MYIYISYMYFRSISHLQQCKIACMFTLISNLILSYYGGEKNLFLEPHLMEFLYQDDVNVLKVVCPFCMPKIKIFVKLYKVIWKKIPFENLPQSIGTGN